MLRRVVHLGWVMGNRVYVNGELAALHAPLLVRQDVKWHAIGVALLS